MRLEFTVEEAEAGRLDRVLAARFPGVGRRRWAEILAAGEVRVNGRRACKGDQVAPGARVEIAGEPAIGDALAPVPQPDLPLEVLHEDARVVALSKPAGVPSHPLRPGETGTAANALCARYPECAGASPQAREGGLVHRLDRGTSGVLLAARDRDAWRALRGALGAGAAEKQYLALVAGRAGAGSSRTWLAQRGRRSVVVGEGAPGALPAETHWRPERSAGELTLLRVTAVTGRMHQVRVHLAAAGHPLVGDPLYGGATEVSGVAVDLPFLHAAAISLPHPGGGVLSVTAPLPPERREFLARLGL